GTAAACRGAVWQYVELDAGHAAVPLTSLDPIQQVLGEQRYRAARRAFFLAAADPRSAGDVQVRPGIGLGETREEAGGGDGAGLGPAGVGDVGEGAVQLLLVLVEQPQLPGAVGGILTGTEQVPGQLRVVAHQAGGLAAQGDDAGAGQGGDVDHRAWLEAFDIGQRVAEHQAAFGVSIEDFDGLAAQGGDDVARAG